MTNGPDRETSDTALATVSELSGIGSDRLTPRQRRVLETIRDSVDRRGYPPTMREIGEAVGLASPSSVKHQLTTLERKGYLRRDPNRPRAIEVVLPGAPADTAEEDGVSSSSVGVVTELTPSHDERVPAPSY